MNTLQGRLTIHCAEVNANRMACVEFRRYCFSRSYAIFVNNGKLAALRRILAEIPCCWT